MESFLNHETEFRFVGISIAEPTVELVETREIAELRSDAVADIFEGARGGRRATSRPA